MARILTRGSITEWWNPVWGLVCEERTTFLVGKSERTLALAFCQPPLGAPHQDAAPSVRR